MNRRIEKRWKRENRKNKGVNTEAKRQARNADVRQAVAFPLPHDPLLSAMLEKAK